jgi:hypothetical protein
VPDPELARDDDGDNEEEDGDKGAAPPPLREIGGEVVSRYQGGAMCAESVSVGMGEGVGITADLTYTQHTTHDTQTEHPTHTTHTHTAQHTTHTHSTHT